MRIPVVMSTVLLTAFTSLAPGQSASQPAPAQPLYQVTIVSRTTKALNYGYLSAPTRIDFVGTPVLSGAHGEAVVEPKRGSTLLKIRVEGLTLPNQFGPNFLTYVVWAISPDGRAQNIGELSVDSSGKARLETSTPLQTFAMIVTVEPYYAVTQPSDIVVMENIVGPKTIGKVEEVNATFELLPRKPYTFDKSQQPSVTKTMVGKAEHEAITALYQAFNAIQIAQSQGADRYAREQLARARTIYDKARQFPVHLSKEIVSMAREATQIAEDSRAIAIKRAAAEKAAEEQRGASVSVEPPPPPSAERQRSRSAEPPPVAPAPLRSTPAREQVPAPASPEQASTAPIEVDQRQFTRLDPQAPANRRKLLASLPKEWNVLDSTRGVVITIPEQNTRESALQTYLTTLPAALRPYKNLHVEVEGHSDGSNSIALTERLAEQVRFALVGAGMKPDIIVTRGLGNTRPRSASRMENRRVEIVISGDAIGTVPTWDRTYTLRPAR